MDEPPERNRHGPRKEASHADWGTLILLEALRPHKLQAGPEPRLARSSERQVGDQHRRRQLRLAGYGHRYTKGAYSRGMAADAHQAVCPEAKWQRSEEQSG